MTPTPPPIPKTVDHKYDVLEQIGSGSFSEVLKVQGPQGVHALKLLKKGFGDRYHHESLMDFKNEFSILKDLNHPNIARILDFGYDIQLEQYYFTTELIEGKDLFAATATDSVDQITDFIVQSLRALIYLHSFHIFHFDIKAANVLLTSSQNSSQVKMIDFGLATPDPQKKIMGTPSYMAPEIINRELPDGRSDLYSLGVLWYYCLTRKNPFRGKGIQETLNNQVSSIPPPPSQLNPNVPPYLDTIILHLLQKNPAYRFQRGEEIIEELNRNCSQKYPLETTDTLLSYLPEEGKLVGRQKQWRALKGTFNAIFQDGLSKKEAPKIILIIGEKGTGKSRLLKELKYFSQLGHVPVVSANATDPSDLEHWTNQLKESSDHKNANPFLFLLDDVSDLMEDSHKRNHLLGHLTRWQYNYLHARTPPRLIILSGLPNSLWQEDPWQSLIDQDILLPNFSVEELAQYIVSLTGLENPPQELVQGIMQRSEGNPLFVTLTLRSLIQNGALFDQSGRWRSSTFEDIGVDFTKAALPNTLEGLLLLPYKQKDFESQKILEIMAVLNKPAAFADLAALVPSKNIVSILQELLQENFLTRDENTKLYSFKNLMMTKILYDYLSPEKRQSWHDHTAVTLQSERTLPFEEWGYHVSRGSDLVTAISISNKLGHHYLQRGLGNKAAEYFEWGLTLNPEDFNVRIDLLMKLGESHLIDHNYQKALAIFAQAKERLSAQKGDDSWIPNQIDGFIRMGGVYLKIEEFDKARSCFEQAQRILDIFHPDPIRTMILDNFKGYLLIQDGKLAAAQKLFQKTYHEWKDDFNDEDKKRVTNNDLGMAYLLARQYEKALKQFQSDLLFYKNLGDTLLTTRCHYHLAETYAALGDADKTIQHYKTCAQYCQKSRNMELLLRAYNGLGNAFLKEKNYKDSTHYYRRSLTLCESTGDMKSHAAISINMGLIYNEIKEWEKALTYLHPAVTFFKKIQNKSAFDWFYLYRGILETADIKRRQKAFDESETLLDEALSIISQSESLTQQQFWVHSTRCELACDAENLNDAQRILKQLETLITDEEQRHKFNELHRRLHPQKPSIDKIRAESLVPNAEDFMKNPYTSILEINKIINAESDLKFVLKTVISYALRLSKAAAGCVLLLNKKNDMEIAAYTHMEMGDEERSISRSIAQKVLEAGKPMMVADAQSDQQFSNEASVMNLKLRSVLGIPISSKNEPIGVLYLDNKFKPEAFSTVNLEVLTAFAEQVGIAISNARIVETLHSQKVELTEKVSNMNATLEHYQELVHSSQTGIETRYNYEKIIARSKDMHEIFLLLDKITDTELSTFIHGESGTGKELIAKALHYNSQRARKRLVTINCGAIPDNLMESELFGHRAGAFTGAVKDKKGLFEEANGGTIFLDEIGELDINLQVKLLRVLQEGEVTRVGETHPVKFDVRVVAASNKDIQKLADEGKFREDLYYRLCQIRIDLPPLRNRKEDIPLLIKSFVKKYSPKKKLKPTPSFLKTLLEYDWPGNVREVENLIQVACALAPGDTIDIEAIPQNYAILQKSRPSASGSSADPFISDIPIDSDNHYDTHLSWYDYEKRIIAKAFLMHEYNVQDTAQSIGIAPTTLYKKIREWNLSNKDNPIYQAPFHYTKGKKVGDYLPEVFEAALEACHKKPYKAIAQLKVSQGYFYKVMKTTAD
jgi:transcriptional regulator with GAF, ATPase, and Fis domain/serine/threonine protein kinase